MKKLFKIMSLVVVPWLASSSYAMTPLTDIDLANETGQSLLTLTNIGQNDASNPMNGQNMGFYKLAIEGVIDINANIRKLQLGCGGANGAGGCDIDIDNLSLSGNVALTGNDAVDRAARAQSDAKITNPFLQIAIKNPNSASTRQVVGVQLGAAAIQGLLTAGTENTGTPNGINALSGFLHIQSAAGSNTLNGAVATAPGFYNTSQFPITGKITAAGIATADFTASGGACETGNVNCGGFWIPGLSGLTFSTQGLSFKGNRKTSLPINTTIALPPISLGFNPDTAKGVPDTNCPGGACNPTPTPSNGFGVGSQTVAVSGTSGNLNPIGTQGGANGSDSDGFYGTTTAWVNKCTALGLISCAVLGINSGPVGGSGSTYHARLYGQVTGLKADVTINQQLGLVHSIALNSPIGLSLQDRSILWPNAPTDPNTGLKVAAEKGWWLAANDPVYLGTVTPSSSVSLCPDASSSATCAYPQIQSQVSNYLTNNPLKTNDLTTLLSHQGVLGAQIGTANLTTPIALTFSGVQLSNQFFAPNCYGGLKFC